MRTSSIGLLSALVAGFGLAVLPSASRADTLAFTFTSDHCTGGCLTGQTSGGTVTLNDVSTGVVDVTVALANGNQFVNTGFDASFGFNLSGITSITYSNIVPSANFTIPGGNPQTSGALHMDGTGFFQFGLDGVGSGGSDPLGSNLTFRITDGATLTVASFIQNAAGQFFAADILSGTTGKTGGIDVSGAGRAVPLPPAALLFGTALVGLGALGRRRRKDALAA